MTRLTAEQLAAVARLFQTLAEPFRLALLQELKAGPRTVGELVAALDAKQANVSKQLAALHDAGLLARDRDGNFIRYSIADAMVFDLCGLVCGKLRRDAERAVAVFGAAKPVRAAPASTRGRRSGGSPVRRPPAARAR
jgi:DNA-binding transcriptional ArsR family regulator